MTRLRFGIADCADALLVNTCSFYGTMASDFAPVAMLRNEASSSRIQRAFDPLGQGQRLARCGFFVCLQLGGRKMDTGQ